MHRLIEHAKTTMRLWSSSDAEELLNGVASLCRNILEEGGLPNGNPDWVRLRDGFQVANGETHAQTIIRWDKFLRFAKFDYPNQDAFIKVGIVTWIVKFTARKFDLLPGSKPISSFDEWKDRLCDCLDKIILVK